MSNQSTSIEIDIMSWLPLHHAVMNGQLDMFKLLVEAGASIVAPSLRGCRCNQSYLHGTDRCYGQSPEWSPLHTAICYGQTHVAKWLLENGAPIWTGPETNALHDAAQHGSLELISFILDNGYQTDIYELNETRLSPVWHAYRNDQCENPKV